MQNKTLISSEIENLSNEGFLPEEIIMILLDHYELSYSYMKKMLNNYLVENENNIQEQQIMYV